MKRIGDLTLDYFWSCPIHSRPTQKLRNVGLKTSPRIEKHIGADRLGIWAYKNAHRLEQRDPNDTSGIWSISMWRAYRLYGNLPRSMHADADRFEMVSTEMWKAAKEFRLLLYRRIVDANSAMWHIRNGSPCTFDCEITTDWYDPPKGRIPIYSLEPKFVGSHSFAIFDFDSDEQVFIFPNSWGSEWGDEGWGYLPYQNWETSLISSWTAPIVSASIDIPKGRGIVLRCWKLGTTFGEGAHCVEIYDYDDDEYIAWSICELRGTHLDVDEFFVRPEHRGKGYARILATHIQDLAKRVGRPLRLVVSFADTETYSESGANAVAKLFGVTLQDATVRWAAKFGAEGLPATPKRSWKPERPASILEMLRPRGEPTYEEPKQYSVFFGTNRRPLDSSDLSKGFSNERGNQLFRGSCLVNIPKTHKFGIVGRKWLSSLFTSKDHKLRLLGIHPMNLEDLNLFASHLVDRFGRKHNLLYIHGYRNSFEDAALCAAQLGVDLKVEGATFFYSWPSTASIAGYSTDEATIEASVTYCFEFVLDLLTAFPDVPLNVIAHSMGNRLAISLFERLLHSEKLPGRLGHLIFAAADVDTDRFKQVVPSVSGLPLRMTSYVSRADGAVQLSELIHSYPRVGLAPPIAICEGVDTILVEGFNLLDFEAHGYFSSAEAVITDIFNLLRHNSSPDERPRTVRSIDNLSGESYWRLPIG
jgi:esterase/lipase superfamily enzyme/GNAT superfamily N-acetyltransferase